MASKPQAQLTSFLGKYSREIGALARAALAKMRSQLPGAVELVYDNYNALVIGFGPSERPSEAICSLALYPRWVSLVFLHGARLDDPDRLLLGNGKQVRYIVLESAATLDDPAVRRLIKRAVALAGKRPDRSARRQMIIRSISKKQRPRRQGAQRDTVHSTRKPTHARHRSG